MKKIIYLFVAILALGIYSCNQAEAKSKKKDGIIRTDIPARPAGQQDMIAFGCDPIETVRVGFV
ncbi:MAG: hypothetical protein K2I90_13075 [Odoribacter sp.]|nr:hypothetical protein [Odoribacter sp.]